MQARFKKKKDNTHTQLLPSALFDMTLSNADSQIALLTLADPPAKAEACLRRSASACTSFRFFLASAAGLWIVSCHE